ncbi:hypothetical protein ACJROX_04670 [Pseudalkalibacillus sp. A8]
MMFLLRYLMIGFFSVTAVSLIAFQSIEIFQAFIETFFTDMKHK